MTATFNELNHAPKFNINDRKDKHFYEQFTAVCFKDSRAYDAVICRLYGTESRSYCCLWVQGNCSWEGCGGDYWRNGSGHAGGYGYHRASASVAEAIANAGITLSEEISGRGDYAIEEAVKAIAVAMWGDSVYVHVTKSHA